MILDEATSALDSVSESSVKTAIDRLRANRTTLVVAHRLTTIENANLIVVMNQGKIVQQGTHQDLIEEVGLYQSLYSKLQHSESVTPTANPNVSS